MEKALGVKRKRFKPEKAGDRKQRSSRGEDRNEVQFKSGDEQARWFSAAFCKFYDSVLSSLEMATVPEQAMVLLNEGDDHSTENLSVHLKRITGPSWKDSLCSSSLAEAEAGSPVVLVICSSASRCVNFLKGLAVFTKECKPGKLFAKHIKVDEQVAALKQRVNICSGTPNRLRKLIDIGALGLSRLRLIVLDMEKDAKNLTLLTVPDVQKEFWELYRLHFHNAVSEGKFRLCLY